MCRSNGRTLKAFEYLYDRKAQKVYFVDEGKWIAFLYRHKLIDDFSEYIRVISAAMGRKGPFRGEHVMGMAAEKRDSFG